MKSVLLAACLAALSLSGVSALPVIRVPIPIKVSVPQAYVICGLNARCLLGQGIIGLEQEEVLRQYSALVEMAIMREVSEFLGNGDSSVEKDSSSEEISVPKVPLPDVIDIPAHEDEPQPKDVPTEAAHKFHLTAIRRPFGHIIIVRTTARTSDESEPPFNESSEESDSELKPSAIPEPKASDESGTVDMTSPTENTPTTETPRDEVPASTDLTNAIEQNSRGSAEEGRRETLGDDSLSTDQVEVFNPSRSWPEMTGADRFVYNAPNPTIRQI